MGVERGWRDLSYPCCCCPVLPNLFPEGIWDQGCWEISGKVGKGVSKTWLSHQLTIISGSSLFSKQYRLTRLCVFFFFKLPLHDLALSNKMIAWICRHIKIILSVSLFGQSMKGTGWSAQGAAWKPTAFLWHLNNAWLTLLGLQKNISRKPDLEEPDWPPFCSGHSGFCLRVGWKERQPQRVCGRLRPSGAQDLQSGSKPKTSLWEGMEMVNLSPSMTGSLGRNIFYSEFQSKKMLSAIGFH